MLFNAPKTSSIRGYASIFAITAIMIAPGVSSADGADVPRGSELSSTQALSQSDPSRNTIIAGTPTSIGNPTVQAEFERFRPKAVTSSKHIDYTIWDEALKNVVLDLGPSIRQRAPRPQAPVGTRMVKGHRSAYRLEGSRFTYSYITDEYRKGLTEYRMDLQSLPGQIDLTALSREEQLAFWFNLHNVSVIEQIAIAYPTKRPADIKLKIDGKKVKLDQAKFINVNGVMMSPRDIRTQIVYPNWTDPNVIYGFYRGDIGSPMLPRYAYDAGNLSYTLNDNAYEFINSLRGFNRTIGHRNVSAIYEEAAPYFFPNWESDLTAHMSVHIKPEIRDELNTDEPIRIDRYDTMVADLSGGQRLGSSGSPIQGQLNMSADTQRLLTEVAQKQRKLRGRGVIGNQPKGWVVIEDLYTEDPDKPAEPQPEISGDQ